MLTVFILIESFLYFICTYTFLKEVHEYCVKRNLLIYLVYIIYFVLLLIPCFIKNSSNYVSGFITIFNIIILKFIFKQPKFKSIVSTYLILYSVNIAISSVLVFINDKSDNLNFKTYISFIISSIILSICFFTFKYNCFNINHQFKLIPTSVKRITLLSTISSCFVISLISDYETFKNTNGWNVGLRISFLILFAFVGAAFPIMIANSVGKSFYLEQSKNFENQIHAQADYYETLSESNYELRRFKHDYNNMRIGVSELLKAGNSNDALKMFNDCDQILNSATSKILKFDSGDGIVDALLTEKQKKASKINTKLVFKGFLTAKNISPTDLCVVFGNTLDNAIEACEKLPLRLEKTVNINCNCKGGFIFLTISNPVVKNIEIRNNFISTSKQDKTNHGFGLYSLKKTIKKYDGDLKLSCKQNIFTLSIEMDLNIKSK